MPKFPAPYDQLDEPVEREATPGPVWPTAAPPAVPQDPIEGGSYRRDADGTLTVLQAPTQQPGGRRNPDPTVAVPAPAPAAFQAQEPNDLQE